MKIYFKIALSLLLFSICTSCEKDKLSEEPDSTVEQTHQQNHTITITIGDAKRAFETDMNNTDRTDENLASPAWEAAINSRYADALDIVITPLDPAEVASDVPGALINVVSYTNDAQETDYYYLVSIPDTDYFIENNYNAEVANFTGVFAAIHKDGTLYDPLIIRGGVPDEVISTTAFEEELACWPPSWWPWGGGVDCPGYGGNFSWAELILTIRMFFSTDTGGPGSTSTPPDNSLTFLSYIWNLNNSDWTTTNTGTPEGGGGVLFNEDLHSGEERIIA